MLQRAAQRLIDYAGGAHGRAVALLLLVSFACFLPGFVSLQPMDRDEPRFAQASKQMLETGDLVDIRFQNEARHKKPVGIHWLQAAFVMGGEALGLDDARTQIWLYRLPSLLAAAGAVLLTYWAALILVPRREAFVAALLLAACILLGVEARLAKTDAVLAATSVLVFGVVARAWMLRASAGGLTRGEALLFWIGLALSILVKGPMLVMVVVLAGAALTWRDRSSHWLRPLMNPLGMLLAVLIVAPWFIAIAMKTGGEFYSAAVGKDLLGKVGSGQENHWAPPGTYLLVSLATLWPASAFAVLAIPYAWRNRRDDAVALCLAWIMPSWLIFEAISTKLPHYILPLVPALAILSARSLAEIGDATARGGWRLAASLVLPALPFLILAAGIGATLTLDNAAPFAGSPIVLLAGVAALASWLVLRRGGGLAAAPPAALAAILLYAGVYGLIWPVLRSIQLSPRLAETVAGLPCRPATIVTSGYREPSLVFLVGTHLAMADGAAAARMLVGQGCRAALVEGRQQGAFAAELGRLGLVPQLVTRLTGFNINGGRRVDIGVYLQAGGP